MAPPFDLTLGHRPSCAIGDLAEDSCGFSARDGRGTLAAMEAVSPHEERLRALLDAGVAITSELSLDALLQRLIEKAVELTDAHYGALGVIGPSGSALERFVTTGIDEETRRAIGDPPRGRGILGALIRDATALRLHDIVDDPRSVGFPSNHPPMHTFLGVPILLRGVAYGTLYLAATAWSRQLESLNEVANALTSETDLDRLLDLIARRLGALLDARIVTVLLTAGESELRFVAAVGEGAEGLVGQTLTRTGSKSGRVLERVRSERVDSVLDDPDVSPEVTRLLEARTGLWVPLVARGRAIGVLGAYDKLGPDPRFTDADLRLAETFASRAAVAVDLSERIARDALRRVVDAQELERRRLARELHDETGQALTSI